MNDDQGQALQVARQVAEDVRAQLEPAGWRVELQTTSLPRFTLVIEHELSSRFNLGLDANHDKLRETLERFLAKFEFHAIANRPPGIEHASLLQVLRANAKGRKWSPDVLPAIALILAYEAVLTEDEAAWLEWAGPVWLDREAEADE